MFLPEKAGADLMDWFGVLGKAILDSSPEGVLFADKNGEILYANASYSNINCRSGAERLKKNIFDTHSNGALAEVLRSGKPVFGKKLRPPGSAVEVIANAFPVFINQELVGGVVFFREARDVLQLEKFLAESEREIRAEGAYTRPEVFPKAEYKFDSLIGESPNFLRALSLARRAAATDSTILLLGESGTGKELFAQAIHNASNRFSRPFIKVNCAAIPDNLLESEFFGYEKGAFTGATSRKCGTFELAHGGTIFLDEIGDMELRLQAKLLHVLESGQFRRVGGRESLQVDVRIIAATNQQLEKLIEEGCFRRDLYYRLNVVKINIPPLRERIDDIPALATKLLWKICHKLERKVAGLTPQAVNMLKGYSWPGNVRELENVLERAVHLTEENDIITPGELSLPLSGKAREEHEIVPLVDWEKIMIKRALSKYGTSYEGKKKTAEALQISVTTLYNKLRKMSDLQKISPYRYRKR